LPVEIATDAGGEFVEPGDATHDPFGMDGTREGVEFPGEMRIAELRRLQASGEFEKVGKQTVKVGEEFVEGRFAVLGELIGVGEQL